MEFSITTPALLFSAISLLLLAFFEFLWQKFAPRVLPSLFERHPSLWGSPP